MSPKRRRSSAAETSAAKNAAAGERLQKVLAAAGIASRRECEELIVAGRVEVDRETVTLLGTRVDPQQQEIRVDGVPLSKPRHVYYMVNKPSGVVSTNRDPQRRPRVIDLVPAEKRLFTIGRLDRTSEGLIIVTNDGELANQLTHPRYGIPKTYRAQVQGHPTAQTLQQLRDGVHLAEGLARVASLRLRGRHTRGSELEIVLTEGRNREIRRILAKVGHKVLHLRRTAIGSVKMGRLQVGEYRALTFEEVRLLRRSATAASAKNAPGGRRRKKKISQRSKSVRAGQAGARSGKSPAAGSQRGSRSKAKVKKAGSKPAKSTGSRTKASRKGTVLDYDKPQGGSGKGAHAKSKKASRKGKRR
jgi:23S rRNA pseudouridine2605 synthase